MRNVSDERAALLYKLGITYRRVAIAGGPNSAKSTNARRMSELSGKDLVELDRYLKPPFGPIPWENIPTVVNDDCSRAKMPSCIIEGTQVPRCLRGAKDGSVPGLDVDLVIWLTSYYPEPDKEKSDESARKGCRTVFDDWLKRDGGKTKVVEL